MLADAKKRIESIVDTLGVKKIGVAVSGGSDSMCLLHFCHTILRQGGVCRNVGAYSPVLIIAVNIDHSTRGGDSSDDSLFVTSFCKKHDIPLSAYIVDAPKFAKQNKLNFEAAARSLRYEIFDKLIRDGTIDVILTAHHAGDQAETVLLHALRGCGGGGLSGIKDDSKRGIYRPLIRTSKAEIEEYLALHKVPYITDKSNFDTTNDRNFLRHKIMPLLEERFCGCAERLGRLAENMAADEDYFKLVITPKDKNKHMILGEDVFCLHNALIARHIFAIAGNLDLERKHIDAIIRLGKSGKEDDRINLPNKMIAWKLARGNVVFTKEEVYKSYHEINGCALDVDREELFKIKLFSKKKKQNFFIDNNWQYLCSNIVPTAEQLSAHDGRYFDRAKLPLTAVLRIREDGDIVYKFDGTKIKLKKYFNNKKLSKTEKNSAPLICDGNRVLLIAGYEVSKELAVDQNSKKIGELCCTSSPHR